MDNRQINLFRKKWLEEAGEMYELIEKIAEEVVEIRNPEDKGYGVRGIEFFTDGIIDVDLVKSSHCSCHPDEPFSLELPYEYLYTDDWREKEQAIVDEKNKEKAERESEDKAEQKLVREAKERMTLVKLKAKYE